ncbi:MAG: VOC family protein [Anaerolineaceae bacterium]|nr:VOC family protein [Anaerolineaceae bacterium]
MTFRTSSIIQTIIALYASDMSKLANFYIEAIDLKIKERGDDFICLGRGEIEVNIIKMNGKPGMPVEKDEGFSIREETPIKCSFLIDSFDQVRKAIKAYGGGLKDDNEAWDWRGVRHLDGFDPEGNVVQFRVKI